MNRLSMYILGVKIPTGPPRVEPGGRGIRIPAVLDGRLETGLRTTGERRKVPADDGSKGLNISDLFLLAGVNQRATAPLPRVFLIGLLNWIIMKLLI